MGKQFEFYSYKNDDEMIANTLRSVFGELLCVPRYKGDLSPFDICANDRLMQEKMRNPATAGFAGVLFPKIVWLLSALNLCVKNGTTILGDNLTDFFIGYGVFVLSLTDIALAVNYKPVFNTEQTFEEVSREFYFHPSRCKVLIGIYLVLTIGFAVYAVTYKI